MLLLDKFLAAAVSILSRAARATTGHSGLPHDGDASGGGEKPLFQVEAVQRQQFGHGFNRDFYAVEVAVDVEPFSLRFPSDHLPRDHRPPDRQHLLQQRVVFPLGV
jgi:hypothetical protein